MFDSSLCSFFSHPIRIGCAFSVFNTASVRMCSVVLRRCVRRVRLRWPERGPVPGQEVPEEQLDHLLARHHYSAERAGHW
jgi:hypothetical protein